MKSPGRIERLCRPVEVARDERDFGLGHVAAGAGDRLARTEGAPRAVQQQLGAKIAKLRHGDAAQRQSRRIAA